MDNIIETHEYKGYKIEIVYDQMPENPMKNWDIIGREAVLKNRDSITGKPDLILWVDELYDEDIDDELTITEYLKREAGAVVVVPYKLYDCGSRGMLLEEVDDAQADGAFYLTEEDLEKEFGNVENARERARECILAEMKVQNMYYNGEVYGYAVKEGNDVLDSVWGFYGLDFEKSGLLEEARSFIDFWEDRRENGLCPQCGKRPEYLVHVYKVQAQYYHDGPKGTPEMNGPERFECPRCRYVIARNRDKAKAFLEK